MGFLGRSIKNIVVGIKKRVLFDNDADSIDIRLNSIPDWLYKITLKNPVDLRSIGMKYHNDVRTIGRELSILMDQLDMRQVLDSTLSRYKAESLASGKKKYVTFVQDFVKTLSADLKSIEEYRAFFKQVDVDVRALKNNLTKCGSVVSEYYDGDVAKVNSLLDKLYGTLVKFFDSFKVSNDDKVTSLIRFVNELDSKIKESETLDNEIATIDRKISTTREHVYKITDKIDELKNSPRFKEVLDREGKLADLVSKRDRMLKALSDKFSSMEISFYQFGSKIREEDLVREYVTHIEQALQHDDNFRILEILEGFIDELNNLQGELRQCLSWDDCSNAIETAKWLRENLKTYSLDIYDLAEKVHGVRGSMRKYVIFNEFEDNESRANFYQGKLKELMSSRTEKIVEIENLNIPVTKERLRKELLLLTGYDVNVIYEKKDESGSEEVSA